MSVPTLGTGVWVERIQRASETFGNSTTLDITIDAVDLTRAELSVSQASGDLTPQNSAVRAYFTSPTNVRFARNKSNASVLPDVTIEVIEYGGDVSVQNIKNDNTLGNDTDTISAVNMGSSLPRMAGLAKAGTSWTTDDNNRMVLTNATTVTWTGSSTNSSQEVAGQVIDYGDECSVQTVTHFADIGADVDLDATISTVEMEDTFLSSSYYHTQSAVGFRSMLWNYRLTDAQTVNVIRDLGANYDYWHTTYVASFLPGVVNVQRGEVAVGAFSSSAAEVINAVNLDSTHSRFLGGMNGMSLARNDDETSDSVANVAFTCDLTDDKTLTLTRDSTTRDCTLDWEVKEFRSTNAADPRLLAGPIAGTAAGGGDENVTETISSGGITVTATVTNVASVISTISSGGTTVTATATNRASVISTISSGGTTVTANVTTDSSDQAVTETISSGATTVTATVTVQYNQTETISSGGTTLSAVFKIGLDSTISSGGTTVTATTGATVDVVETISAGATTLTSVHKLNPNIGNLLSGGTTLTVAWKLNHPVTINSGATTLTEVTSGGLETTRIVFFGRYKVYNPDKLGEISLRKLAWLRGKTR